ncbi:MAG TPA: RsmD family RNA methyltransferase [Phycisphaerae bacterium]|nr:RsmD family RNA methyltransferase [Phycisphaerae bacterium]
MRILSGKYKGHKLLPPPPGSPTRPITGRVKKSLFGMLSGRLVDAAVVDLYCGTGSMGLEALSRDARACWFAERDRRVLGRLRRNIEALGAAAACTVWAGDLTRGLARRLDEIDTAVDVAFVDPPYAAARRWSWPAAESTIFAPLAEHLARDGVVALRLPRGAEPPEALGGLALRRTRRYGEMVLALLEHREAE